MVVRTGARPQAVGYSPTMAQGDRYDVVVIGAGQAGISTSHALSKRNISHLIAESDAPFASWRDRWEGFRTNTPSWMNTLPVLDRSVFPGASPNSFATGAEMVDYFDKCLAELGPPVHRAHVTSVERTGSSWVVQAGDRRIEANSVVVCNGAMSTPRIPEFASLIPAGVPQLHSSEYRNPEQISTSKVLVVGSAASGIQIGRLLATSGQFDKVHLATSRVMVLPRHIAGVPIHRVVHAFGLFDVRIDSALGKFMYSGLETRGDPIMRPTPKDLAQRFGVRLHGRLSGIDGSSLTFADSSTLNTDDLTILWCTGFQGDYSFIHPGSGEEAFDEAGHPRHRRGVVPDVPGLYFVGLRYQHTSASHDIYGVAKDAEFVTEDIANRLAEKERMKLVPVTTCCVCKTSDAEKIASGWDFEYRTSPDVFGVRQCKECGNVYLNPRPDVSELERIYPSEYHSLDFTAESFSLVHSIRSRLEARRLLRYCENVPSDARILDIGCGDGFHLKLLRRFGKPGWNLEGVDLDARAVELASRHDVTIHQGAVEDIDLGENRYDVVYTIQTLEHVAHPDKMLAAIHRLLKPGGRLVIVTDNTDSVDFGLFKKGHWGGYHFPRHWNLFNPSSLRRLARTTGFEVDRIDTIVSPVNWVYSIHNTLVDRDAPQWLVNRFTLKSPVSLGFFTLVDMGLQRLGRGALLNAFLRKPQ